MIVMHSFGTEVSATLIASGPPPLGSPQIKDNTLIAGAMDGVVRVYSLEGLVSHVRRVLEAAHAEAAAAVAAVDGAAEAAALEALAAAKRRRLTDGTLTAVGGGTDSSRGDVLGGSSVDKAAASRHPPYVGTLLRPPSHALWSPPLQAVRLSMERKLLRALSELTRIKSVSCDPSYSEECFKGAKYIAKARILSPFSILKKKTRLKLLDSSLFSPAPRSLWRSWAERWSYRARSSTRTRSSSAALARTLWFQR